MLLLTRNLADLCRFITLTLFFQLCFSFKNNDNTYSYHLGQYLITIANNPFALNNPCITITNDITSNKINNNEYNDNDKLINENIIWKTNENIPFLQLGKSMFKKYISYYL